MMNRMGYGFGHRSHRFFHRGDFKYLILDLLKDKPRYGYEIIRELEDRFQGFYAPSPGIVYPTLQWLEEVGYVTSEAKENKKIYTITDAGRTFLAEQQPAVDDLRSQWKETWSRWNSEVRDDLRDVRRQMADLWRLLGQKARNLNAENLKKIREILARATKEIGEILKS